MQSYIYNSKSENDTKKIAFKMASMLKKGDLIVLCGDLGSGKTKFTEGFLTYFGLEDEISKLIISLYDETSNSSIGKDKKIADKCLELWDIMFEKQLGSVREISRKLMER